MAITRGGGRQLTPSISRRVRDGARAANALAIEAAIEKPTRQDARRDVMEREGVTEGTLGQATDWRGRVADAIRPAFQIATQSQAQVPQLSHQMLPQHDIWGRQARGDIDFLPSRSQVQDAVRATASQVNTRATLPTTGNPSVDDLRSKMRASENDAKQYADIIARHSEAIDELNRQQLAAIQAGAMEVAAEYDEKINELKGRIADARLGLKRSMEAFAHYSAQVAPAMEASVEAAQAGEAARAEALEGRAEAAAGKIEQGYDAATEDVEEVADLVGAGAMVLDESLRGAVARFEDMVKEAARGRIEDVDRLSAASAKFATAQAEAIQAQDAFLTDVEKEQVEIQIQSQIDAMLDNVAQLEKDKARAVQAALDRYDPLVADFDSAEEAWAFVLDNFILDQGWSMEDEEAIRAMLADMDGVTNRAEAEAWVRENQLPDIHYAALADYILQYRDPDEDTGELALWMQDLISQIVKYGPDSEQGYEAVGTLSRALRPDGVDLSVDDVKDLFRAEESNLDQIYEVFDLYAQHVQRWNEARAATAKSGGGQGGVNNYANRNEPQYVRRRNVGVPTFVNEFLNKFGKVGTGREYVGGVTSSYRGALRNPNMKGGGRAADSDHLSGGAVDLYGVTVDELEAIARWAQSHPGVASVVYWGNKYHETGKAGGASAGNNGRGHVHVSLKLGYY